MYIRKKRGYIGKSIYKQGTSKGRDLQLEDNLCLKLAWQLFKNYFKTNYNGIIHKERH